MNNFLQRTLSSVVFVAVMVACLLLSRVAYGALFLVIMAVAMQEFFSISLSGQYKVQQKLALLAAAAFFITVTFFLSGQLDGRWIATGIIPLVAIPVSVLFCRDRSGFGNIAYLYAGFAYIATPVVVSSFLVSRDGGFDGFLLLSLFVIIWLCDVGAYCIGTAFGQKPDSKKLAPSISPKKSWWGFWGGVAFGILSAVALNFIGWLPFGLAHNAVLGALVSVSGVFGDLFESLWKRYFGVKDSGNCIPGHGGMLDRFDSSFIAIPVAFVYLILFGLI